jgi:hypothetical protein
LSFNHLQNDSDSLGFKENLGLGLIIQRTIISAGVEIHSGHAIALHEHTTFYRWFCSKVGFDKVEARANGLGAIAQSGLDAIGAIALKLLQQRHGKGDRDLTQNQ